LEWIIFRIVFDVNFESIQIIKYALSLLVKYFTTQVKSFERVGDFPIFPSPLAMSYPTFRNHFHATVVLPFRSVADGHRETVIITTDRWKVTDSTRALEKKLRVQLTVVRLPWSHTFFLLLAGRTFSFRRDVDGKDTNHSGTWHTTAKTAVRMTVVV